MCFGKQPKIVMPQQPLMPQLPPLPALQAPPPPAAPKYVPAPVNARADGSYSTSGFKSRTSKDKQKSRRKGTSSLRVPLNTGSPGDGGGGVNL